jgi:hypothetical protein
MRSRTAHFTGLRARSSRLIAAVVTLGLEASLGAGSAAAQVTIGMMGGLNLATASITTSGTDLTPGTRTAYHGAVVIGMQVGTGFAVEGQVRFAGKGFEPGDSGSGVSGSLTMDYVETPILATFTFPRDPSLLAARVFAGPSVGLRASCNLTTPGDQIGFTDCGGDLSRTLDFSAVVGAGIKIRRGLGGFLLDVSYDWGFVDVTSSGQDASVYNRNLLFSAGFLVPIL